MNIMSYSTGIMNGRLKKFLIQKEDISVRGYLLEVTEWFSVKF